MSQPIQIGDQVQIDDLPPYTINAIDDEKIYILSPNNEQSALIWDQSSSHWSVFDSKLNHIFHFFLRLSIKLR